MISLYSLASGGILYTEQFPTYVIVALESIFSIQLANRVIFLIFPAYKLQWRNTVSSFHDCNVVAPLKLYYYILLN